MTDQQVFDNALNQVRKQQYMRSFDSERQCCAYRGEHGRKCAVGASIPDSLYSRDIEGETASQILCRTEFINLFVGVSPLLLSALQRLHDDGFAEDEQIDSDNYEAGMERLAVDFGLVYTSS